MKNKKQFLLVGLLLLCAVLVTGLLVHATRVNGAAASAPKLTLSNETANPGEDVSVAVDLSENPGLMVMMLHVSYDHTRLILTGATGVGLSGWDLSGDTLLWLGNADSSYNGTILTLNFRVPDTAEEGAAAVTITCNRGDMGNHDEQTFLPVVTAGSVTVQSGGAGTPLEPVPIEVGGAEIPFTDVYENSYYYAAVVWAYQNGVTNGRGSDTFDPEGTCTRAEAVTFLWRAVGCPEPAGTNNPFTDVKEGSYYYKPVLWAYENGITCGTSATRFSPRETCTTAQIVTFAYRALGVGTDGWYREAGDWANGLGLMSGTGLLVDPDETCPRSAVVSVLYRWSQSR